MNKGSSRPGSISEVTASSDEPTTRTSLTDLPAEIRVMILRELLESETPIHQRSKYIAQGLQSVGNARRKSRSKRPYLVGYRLNPSILAVSKLFYREGYPILYGSNVLVLDIVAPSLRDRRNGVMHSDLSLQMGAGPPMLIERHQMPPLDEALIRAIGSFNYVWTMTLRSIVLPSSRAS